MRIVILLAVLLAGCNKPMTNDEIIAEHEKCKAAGLDTRQLINGLELRTVAVECVIQMEGSK